MMVMANRIVLRETRKSPKPKRRKTNNKVRAKKANLPDGKDRLNLQINEELKEWAKSYARRHHTTLTQLIADHFVSLRKKEEGEGVDQI
jgi:hypothetical protein